VSATTPSTSTSSITPWRVAAIGAVALLAVGIGVAAGSFLLGSRSGALGVGASYVPADAPLYVELRIEPSAAQDASLREFLANFPPIEGVDLERPLFEQLGETFDEMLAGEATVELSWSEDVEPWFDGRMAIGVAEIPLEALDEPMDPMTAPPVPEMVVVLGVTDPDAATATIERLMAEMPEGPSFSETEHGDVTIHSSSEGGGGAYAVTDDALLLGPDAVAIERALDQHAAPATSLAEAQALGELTAELPSDWLAFVAYDMTELMAASWQQMGDLSPEMTEAFRALVENQSLRGAMAMTAGGDRLTMEVVADAPTGPFAPTNAERGLADEVPADVLYYAEGGNIGAALAAMVGPMKDAVASAPDGEEQLAMVEAALGGDLEELVSWIGDGAVAVGWDGSELFGGTVLIPTDPDAAARRLDQLATFASLAALDPASGISVAEREVAGQTVTTITWEDSGGSEPIDPMLPAPTGVVVEFTVTDDRALIGLGDAFVERVLTLDGGSLADEARFSDAVDELGGPANAGVTWLDLAGVRAAVDGAMGPMLDAADPEGSYEADLQPWLEPLDRIVSVASLESDLLVQRSALLVE
jgi:Protein of unknown function (DUF3352)